MKKISGKNITPRSIMLISMMIASGLMLFSFNLNTIMAVPADILERGGDYLYGRSVGIVENENGEPLWIISGTWRTNLSNQTQSGDNSTVFNANFEMIKTDGTSRHTHTLTNYILTDVSSQNNSTIFNGTGTISMPEGPVTEVPVNIQVLNNTLGMVFIGPDKIDSHFGTKPIYGIPLEDREHKEKNMEETNNIKINLN